MKKEGLPEEGDIVLATVERVSPHAAFIRLEEYDGVEGLIHISEASKTWVKNLQTFFHPNQQVVCKVIEVKPNRFVHASTRRVSDYDRKAKWDQIKREKRVEAILKFVAKKSGKKVEEIYDALRPFEEEHGEIYFAFEEAKKEGKSFFKGLPFADELWALVDKSISLPVVSVKGTLSITSYAGDGVERIRAMLRGVEGVTYIGSGKYRLQVEATDYKEAEKKLSKLVERVKKAAGKTESVEFERDRKK